MSGLYSYATLRFFVADLRSGIRAHAPDLTPSSESQGLEARQVADSKGVEVIQGERAELISGHLEQRTVVGYCIRHPFPKSARWSLLKRKFSKTGELPNYHRLFLHEGQFSDQLLSLLREIALSPDWIKYYLEVEFYPEKVCLFWDETGGPQLAGEVRDYALKLSRAQP
jgi:hypothetical protein